MKAEMKEEISYQEFEKLDIRVAQVVAAEPIEGADRLLKITLDVGELGERTVAAGIKEWYKPEQLVGKTVVYLANLAPRTLRGVESQGMLLAGSDDEDVALLTPEPEKELAPGSIVR